MSEVTVKENDSSVDWEATLRIRDCNDTISLALWPESGGLDNTEYKIDKLIAHLVRFKQAVVKSRVIYEQAKARVEERRKARRTKIKNKNKQNEKITTLLDG
jgi:hypothetical protein